MTTPTIYLDTNHISRLARHPEDPVCAHFLSFFEHERARLAFSLLHLHELSDPAFVSRADVGLLLDSLPLDWAVYHNRLFDLETESALAKALTGSPTPIRAFYPTSEAAWVMPAQAAIPPSRMLEVWGGNPQFRNAVESLGTRGARLQQLYGVAAAAVRDPEVPLLARLRDHPPETTPAGLFMPGEYTPADLLARAGGLAAFPSYRTLTLLTGIRAGDPGFPAHANHILDEFHAIYSPYAAVTVLDRATADRCRSAKLPHANAVFNSLETATPAVEAFLAAG